MKSLQQEHFMPYQKSADTIDFFQHKRPSSIKKTSSLEVSLSKRDELYVGAAQIKMNWLATFLALTLVTTLYAVSK